MRNDLTVSEVAGAISRETGVDVQPRHISDLFYRRALPEAIGPIVGGRRLIARKNLPLVREALSRHGKLGPGPTTGSDDCRG
jgi:hypothetical protein